MAGAYVTKPEVIETVITNPITKDSFFKTLHDTVESAVFRELINKEQYGLKIKVTIESFTWEGKPSLDEAE